MGHVGQEGTLGPVGFVGLIQGILQKTLLLHLVADLLIHAAETKDNTVVLSPYPCPHHLHLEIVDLAVTEGPVIDIALFFLRQFLHNPLPADGLTQHVPVLLIDKVLYVGLHTLPQIQFAVKYGAEHVVLIDPENISAACVQIKKAHHPIVDTEGMNQFRLLPFILLLLQLLGRPVQEEALIHQLPVFPDQLHVAHNMADTPVPALYPVLDGRALSLFFKLPDTLPQLFFILSQHGLGNHVKACLNHLLLGIVFQDLQGRPVDTDDPASVQSMAHDSAVDGSKDRLQCAVFLYDLLLIGPLLCHIDGHPHGSHNASIHIVKRRLVGSQQFHAVSGPDSLLGDAGLSSGHNLPLRIDAGLIVFLHIPNIGMSPAFHLLPGLVHGPAETVVDFLMDPRFIFIPDQIGHMVDGGVQILSAFPEILACLVSFLPLEKPEPQLFVRHGPDPDVFYV